LLREKKISRILLTDLSELKASQINTQDCTEQEILTTVGGGGKGWGGGGGRPDPSGPGIYLASFGPGNSREEIFFDDDNDPSNGFFQYRRQGSKSTVFYTG
jgi:hypothetical protein